jgi:hypothetical protein
MRIVQPKAASGGIRRRTIIEASGTLTLSSLILRVSSGCIKQPAHSFLYTGSANESAHEPPRLPDDWRPSTNERTLFADHDFTACERMKFMTDRLAPTLLATALLTTMALSGTDAVRTASVEARLAVPGSVNTAPSVAAQGRTVVIAWAASRNGVTDVYAATSRDGGAVFSPPRRVNDQDADANFNGDQATRVTIGGTQASPVITVIWPVRKSAIRMARSVDRGKSFARTVTMHDPHLQGVRGWHSATAGPDGTLHALWLDGRNAEGVSDPTTKIPASQQRQDVFHAALMPDGRILETRVATDVCYCCKTAVAVGPSGRVYAAWRHVFSGSIRDIAFSLSRDSGASFAPLVRVSQDNWAINGCPEDGPAMVVDASDAIHLVWPTVVSEGQQKALFYAFSQDGRGFSDRRRIPTQGPTTPSHPQLALGARGEIAIVWDEVQDGKRRVSMSRLPQPATKEGPRWSPPLVLSAEEPARFPVVAGLVNGFVVAWTSGAPDTSVIAVRRVFSKL